MVVNFNRRPSPESRQKNYSTSIRSLDDTVVTESPSNSIPPSQFSDLYRLRFIFDHHLCSVRVQ